MGLVYTILVAGTSLAMLNPGTETHRKQRVVYGGKYSYSPGEPFNRQSPNGFNSS